MWRTLSSTSREQALRRRGMLTALRGSHRLCVSQALASSLVGGVKSVLRSAACSFARIAFAKRERYADVSMM